MQHSAELQIIFNALNPSANDSNLHIDPKINWNTLYKLTIHHRVWHQIYRFLTPHKKAVPAAIYQRLGNSCQRNVLQLLATAAETARIARKFTEHRIQHCFVKGIVLNTHIYGALTTRPCKDIDVWVHRSTYQQAIETLLSLGYQKSWPTYELIGYQKNYHMKHRHDIEFYHEERKIIVELHFSFLDPFGLSFFSPTTESTQTINLLNTPITTLQDDYHLLYLMLHGAVHAWNRLRWLNDINLYIKSEKCDLHRVMELAKSIQCHHIAEQCLLLTQTYFKQGNNKLILNPNQRSIKIARMAKTFMEANFQFTPGYRVYNKMSIKYRFYLVKLAPPSQKLRVILGDLVKIDNVFPYIKLPEKLSFMYYILYPAWILKRLIAR